jgi:hypothetical protein
MTPDSQRQAGHVAQAREGAFAVWLGVGLVSWRLCHDQSQSCPGCPLSLIHDER